MLGGFDGEKLAASPRKRLGPVLDVDDEVDIVLLELVDLMGMKCDMWMRYRGYNVIDSVLDRWIALWYAQEHGLITELSLNGKQIDVSIYVMVGVSERCCKWC